MGKLYDSAFNAGFAGTVIFFVILNIVSFLPVYQRRLECVDRRPVISGGCRGGNWGFPFYWFGYDKYFFEDGFVGLLLNFTAIVGCGFAAGFTVRYIRRRFI
jgi:hypothetical protein